MPSRGRWAGRRERMPGAWWLFASACFVYVIRTAQWSPLLMAAALTPVVGWLLTCKPSVGLALFVAYPTGARRDLARGVRRSLDRGVADLAARLAARRCRRRTT